LLTREVKEKLIQHLASSMEKDRLSEIDEAWIAEAERRFNEYKKDPSKAISGENLIADIRSEFGWKNYSIYLQQK
jgi:putative addiction module component (TIGR02574 family)